MVAGSAASYLYSTGPGKRAIWAQLLDELGLRGDEHVLDVGCGPRRGADAGGASAARRPGGGSGDQPGTPALTPVPQELIATIEARFRTADVSLPNT